LNWRGTGVFIDCGDDHYLLITNYHVMRDIETDNRQENIQNVKFSWDKKIEISKKKYRFGDHFQCIQKWNNPTMIYNNTSDHRTILHNTKDAIKNNNKRYLDIEIYWLQYTPRLKPCETLDMIKPDLIKIDSCLDSRDPLPQKGTIACVNFVSGQPLQRFSATNKYYYSPDSRAGYIYHTAACDRGASGCGLFNTSLKLIAIHHTSICKTATKEDELINIGSKMIDIINEMMKDDICIRCLHFMDKNRCNVCIEMSNFSSEKLPIQLTDVPLIGWIFRWYLPHSKLRF